MNHTYSIRVGIALFLAGAVSACSYRPILGTDPLPPGVTIQETRDAILFQPSAPAAATGLVFYPGGLVDTHVYDRLLSRFAAQGTFVAVAKMPGHFAFFDLEAGRRLQGRFPGVASWVIAGHSLGGSMAASAVSAMPGIWKGLILMDAYPPDGDSLKSWSGAVLSLYSSREKTNDVARQEKTLSLLPPATWIAPVAAPYPALHSNFTVLYLIEGGRHSYFGSYGPQDGDAVATISQSAFHDQVLAAMGQFFAENGWRR
ncbi:MAG: hypothetical protein J0L75_11660 [Spirochaetes bacterium]|nr:hypothetical protein [Spirochaetota bacterium]